MSLLEQVFAQKDRKAFIAYITAGDPTPEYTPKMVDALVAAGVDVVELGVPFSDPVGDGPTNQKSCERALAHGVSLRQVIGLAAEIHKKHPRLPIVLFSYFNPIFQMGLKEFADAAVAAGVSGTLVVDLPPEEARDYVSALRAHKIDTIFLASPTTTRNRLAHVDELSSGFVYYVSRTGVTGAQKELSSTLTSELAEVRKWVKKSLAVGFGIATPEQARTVAQSGDGVVVGSALVKLVEQHGATAHMIEHLRTSAKALAEAVHGSTGK